MASELKTRVQILEAACHRVLHGDEDPLSIKALSMALEIFDLPVTGSDPAVLRGVANVAMTRAAMVKTRIEESESLHEGIEDLCAALADLHRVLDAHPNSGG